MEEESGYTELWKRFRTIWRLSCISILITNNVKISVSRRYSSWNTLHISMKCMSPHTSETIIRISNWNTDRHDGSIKRDCQFKKFAYPQFHWGMFHTSVTSTAWLRKIICHIVPYGYSGKYSAQNFIQASEFELQLHLSTTRMWLKGENLFSVLSPVRVYKLRRLQ